MLVIYNKPRINIACDRTGGNTTIRLVSKQSRNGKSTKHCYRGSRLLKNKQVKLWKTSQYSLPVCHNQASNNTQPPYKQCGFKVLKKTGDLLLESWRLLVQTKPSSTMRNQPIYFSLFAITMC